MSRLRSKSSRLRRMINLEIYQHKRRNKRIPGRPRIVRTPIRPRTFQQRQKLADLESNLEEYRMSPDHTLIEHVKIVNNMLQELIDNGKPLDEKEKYDALKTTLLEGLKEALESYWTVEGDKVMSSDKTYDFDFLHGKTNVYKTLVYLFVEDNTLKKNMSRSSVLAESSTLRSAKHRVGSNLWLKDMVTDILDREGFEQSIPKNGYYIM